MANRNEQLFERAKNIIPGGVNSPVRAFGSVGGVPMKMGSDILITLARGDLRLWGTRIPKWWKLCAK